MTSPEQFRRQVQEHIEYNLRRSFKAVVAHSASLAQS